ncbi:MAG: MmcQ/YjbR family DNA-binding protein [Flavobacteriales bacterium]
MNSQTVRAMALDMPGTAVKEHHGRPSYSVKKKTYMTVWPYENRAVMKLTVQQQATFCEAHPDAFAPSDSKLGKHGWTTVHMDYTSERLFRYAMDLAWRNVAPKWLIPTREAPPRG